MSVYNVKNNDTTDCLNNYVGQFYHEQLYMLGETS